MAKKANYFKESVEELQHVTWPEKKEVIRTSWIVLLFVVIMGFGLAFIDSLLNQGYQAYTVATEPFRMGTGSAMSGATLPDIQTSGVQAVDANGNPIDINISPSN